MFCQLHESQLFILLYLSCTVYYPNIILNPVREVPYTKLKPGMLHHVHCYKCYYTDVILISRITWYHVIWYMILVPSLLFFVGVVSFVGVFSPCPFVHSLLVYISLFLSHYLYFFFYVSFFPLSAHIALFFLVLSFKISPSSSPLLFFSPLCRYFLPIYCSSPSSFFIFFLFPPPLLFVFLLLRLCVFFLLCSFPSLSSFPLPSSYNPPSRHYHFSLIHYLFSSLLLSSPFFSSHSPISLSFHHLPNHNSALTIHTQQTEQPYKQASKKSSKKSPWSPLSPRSFSSTRFYLHHPSFITHSERNFFPLNLFND